MFQRIKAENKTKLELVEGEGDVNMKEMIKKLLFGKWFLKQSKKKKEKPIATNY